MRKLGQTRRRRTMAKHYVWFVPPWRKPNELAHKESGCSGPLAPKFSEAASCRKRYLCRTSSQPTSQWISEQKQARLLRAYRSSKHPLALLRRTLDPRHPFQTGSLHRSLVGIFAGDFLQWGVPQRYIGNGAQYRGDVVQAITHCRPERACRPQTCGCGRTQGLRPVFQYRAPANEADPCNQSFQDARLADGICAKDTDCDQHKAAGCHGNKWKGPDASAAFCPLSIPANRECKHVRYCEVNEMG
jgi:hypothetical protein